MPLLTTQHTVGIWGGRGGLGVVGWSASGMFTLRKHLPRENSACNRPGKQKYVAASYYTPQFFRAAKGTFFQATVNLKQTWLHL